MSAWKRLVALLVIVGVMLVGASPASAAPRKLTASPTPTISGTAKIGKTLTAKAGKWKPSPVKLSYQWLRNGKKIKGATKRTYKLVTADKGKKISVKVTGKRNGYQTVSRTSKRTSAVKKKSSPWVLTHTGFGPLTFGEEVPGSWRGKFEPGSECFGDTLQHSKYGTVEIWSEDGTVNTQVTALILADKKARTKSGVHIGTTLASVKKKHGNLKKVAEDDWSGIARYESRQKSSGAGSLSQYFEVLDGKVIGISLEPSGERYIQSDRICGGA